MPNDPEGYMPLVAGTELVNRSPELAQFDAAAIVTTLPPPPE